MLNIMEDMTHTMNSPNSKELQNKMDSVNHVSVVIQFDPQAFTKFYPELEEVCPFDYKVRIRDEKKGTTAKSGVLVESGDRDSKWGTVGVSEDIIEASWQALIDSILYKLSAIPKNKTTHA